MQDQVEARRYTITGVLGKGGFGNVYRATMDGAGGFTKKVAIKLLRDAEVPELTLRRFRDEARILGLVRDRAIVNVDPPTRLAGRWAVVMEYVEGASIQRLLQLGPIPPGVVAEIVQEVARVLDKVYRAPGPNENEPLRLLHRDLKPANLQITPDGEVKVLDFGIAKADFATREAHTQAYVGGTKGFIAPERLEGQDGPEGDVFSLGVTAHVMLTGERPSRRQMMGLEASSTASLPADAQEMLALATRMRSPDPARRPSAREVEEACAKIRRADAGASLRNWAEENIPKANAVRPDDDLVGHVLTETLAAMPSEERLAAGHELLDRRSRASGAASAPAPRGDRLLRVALFGVLALAVMMLGVSLASFVLGGGVLAINLGGGVAQTDLPEAPERPVTAPVPATAAPAADPAGVDPAAAAPAPEEPAPTPAPEPATEPTATEPTAAEPTATSPAPPAPADAAPKPRPGTTPKPGAGAAPGTPPETPAPEPAAAAATYPVTFGSAPLGAAVFVDGKPQGETPIVNLALSAGTHHIKMVSDQGTIERDIQVGSRAAKRFVWKGGTAWESYYQ